MTAIASLTAYINVSVTMTVTATPSFTDARCPSCNRKLMAIPGRVIVQTRAVASDATRSGRGRVVSCHRCSSLVEVIEHTR